MDAIEFIADSGDKRLFRVQRVVHTVQSSSTERPRVRDERAGARLRSGRAAERPVVLVLSSPESGPLGLWRTSLLIAWLVCSSWVAAASAARNSYDARAPLPDRPPLE